MPRSRKPGTNTNPYEVRWHSLADMTTPSVDIMSSPDPLNETFDDHNMVPSSVIRKGTWSQPSHRLSSRATSPRKQTFELEYDNDKSPKRLLITIEPKDVGRGAPSSGTRRRLFQLSSPRSATRKGQRAVTTLIPLRGSEDNEATPRRRGPGRKTNGTPLPGAGMKRKASSSIGGTPEARRVRTTKGGESQTSSAKPTPQSRKRGPGRPRKSSLEPSSELGSKQSQNSSPRRKPGRPRKYSIDPGEVARMVKDTPIIEEEPVEAQAEIVVNTSPVASEAGSFRKEAFEPDEDEDEDIWMATLNDEVTPRVTRSVSARMSSPPQPRHKSPEQDVEEERRPEEEEEDMDYGYLPAAGSDVSSIDEPPTSAKRPDDTIAQGEDFSQILMDSIPSFRDLRSSVFETTHNYFGEETSVIINNTLEALRQSTAQRREAEAEAEEPSITEPPLPVLPAPVMEEPQEPKKMPEPIPKIAPSPRRSRALKLSPHWTQSPRRGGSSPLRQQVLKSQARQTDDGSKVMEDEQHDVRTSASRGEPKKLARGHDEESNLYDDSFSEIPQYVLDTATPRHKEALVHIEETEIEEQQAVEIEDDEDEDEEMDLIEGPESHQGVEEQHGPVTASNPSVGSAGRLPTPDDTPPQVDSETGQDHDKATQISQSSPLAAPPIQAQDVPGIVEISEDEDSDEDELDEEIGVDEEVDEIERSLQEYLDSRNSLDEEDPPQVEETPINQMTSPLKQPQSVVPEVIPEKMARPALSPIVRAGRVLQSVTSDPPSPRENQLRSPFRGSATKESGFTSRGPSASASPRRSVAYSDASTQLPSVPEVYDDPFASGTRHTGQVSFMEALSRSSTAAGPKNHVSSRESAASSMRITPPSDVEMSWVANEGPISDNLRGDVSLREVARGAGSSAQTNKPDAAVVAEDEAEDIQEDDDDELDIWELEAQREIPRSTRQQPFGKKVAVSSVMGRRGALPSPWMRQRAQKQKTTEEAPPRKEVEEEPVGDDMTEDAAPETTEAEEYSLLAQRQKAQQASSAHKSATKASRFELSTFFSSPALIPGQPGAKPGLAARVPGARTNALQPEQQAAPVLPTSSMFPQIPQKQNFTPRPRAREEPAVEEPSRTAAPTPPRMQLSHADIQKWRQDTLSANQTAAEPQRKLLQALPPKNASPSKSSLRSPLKPHTPGRVVEFTSSVLSPVEQAKIRQQRRLSQSSASAPPSAIRPAPKSTFMDRLGAFPQLAPPQMDGREVDAQATDATMSEAVQSSELETLSQTVWTRQHWQLMTDIIQMRREGPFDPPYERCADRCLGKIVITRGERVKIARWHLDCVDAFKAEVGGWDELHLAKRFIGAILGDEKRGQGIVMPRLTRKRRRQMFH